jgi:hypothetical protein
LRDSSDTYRPTPGASRSSPLERTSAPSSRLDRVSILDRYRSRDRSGVAAKAPVRELPTGHADRPLPRRSDAPPWILTEKPTPPATRDGAGLSQLRSRRSAPPPWIEHNDRGRDDLRTAPLRGESKNDLQKIRSRAKEKAQVESTRRLDRLVAKDPKTGSDILRKGGQITVATDAAVRTAVGVGLGLSGGGGTGQSCFWDPCSSWTHHCAPFWNWWCSPCGSWWWSSCCVPWWGCGYWCGGWCNNWNCWCGSCWPSTCYAPYPLYYSTVVYDSYAPPAQEVVYVEQPATPAAEEAAAPEAPAAEGEGSVQVAAPGESSGAGGARGGTQALATQHLTLGDEAFRQGRYSDAVHEYAKAVELAPQQGVLHLILSDALFATGDYHYAAYALRRALELDPTLVDSVIDKHSFYGEPAEFDRQVDLLERYLEDHFLDEDARLLLAANYLFGAKPAQAVDLLQSPFSSAIRETPAGKVLVERANKLLHEPASKPESPK